jgi:dTDP-4-dehydrorhamnose reductase
MKLKILLTGKSGQVGSELLQMLPAVGDVVAPGRQELDLLDGQQIRRMMQEIRPNLIVNAAAFTAVDAAEKQQREAQAINAEAPAILAEEALKCGAAMVHYSTDYVFDGTKKTPYTETDLTRPLNVYGKTKLTGEEAIRTSGVAHLILRTEWVYGVRGRNFSLTILKMATQKEEIRVVCDQIGAPTWSQDIAESTVKILRDLASASLESRSGEWLSHVSGIYHLTAGGETTWHGFASAIIEEAAKIAVEVPWVSAITQGKPLITTKVTPINTSDYPTPAARPAYSLLSNARLKQTFGVQVPHWHAQLHRMFAS